MSSELPNSNNNDAPQPTTDTTTTTTTPTTPLPLVGEGAEEEITRAEASKFVDRYEKVIQEYGHEYMKNVMEMAKQTTYTLTLNVLDKDGKKEPDPWEEGKERDVYVGTEQKSYTR